MTPRLIRIFLIAAAGAAAFEAATPPLAAQEVQNVEEETVERLRRELDAQRRIEAVREESEERRPVEGIRRVTYADILKDPDNLELNYRFAQSQLAEGNVLGAAATLERILLVNPELDKVRLLYAIVLYRLDNWNEARKELNFLLERENLEKSLRSEVEEYVKRLNRRIRRTLFTLRQSTGYQFDTNRNAAASSKKRLFAGTLLDVPPSGGRQRDGSLLNVTTVDVVHDLGYQAGHEIFGSFTYYLQEQTVVDSLDLQSFQYHVGSNLKTPWVLVVPRFYAGHISLSRETFLRTQGGALGLSRPIGRRWNVFSDIKVERQDFEGVSENPTAPQRKGRYIELESGTHFALTPVMRLTGSVLYGNKTAEEEFNAYERLVIGMSHMWLFPRGRFLINSVELGRDIYDEPDTFVALRVRRENSIRYRVTAGTPLAALPLGRYLPAWVGDVVLTLTYEYYRSLSNITNYTYRNNKFQGMLTKTVEF